MEDRENMRTTIAAALAGTTDYISATMPSVNMVMDGYYQQFQKDTSAYFENVLHNLQKIHQDAFDRREQELYRQIAELQGQNLDLQEQLSAMTEKCSQQKEILEKQKEKFVDRQNKKYRVHTSPWGLKKVLLAWKTLAKRAKQRVKTEKILDHWEKKHFLLKMFALWNHGHNALKYDHGLTDNKFKYETLSNEMVMHYENEQSKLQNDLRDAYALVKKEELKRIQLEESMRKMFLKNMNTLNMEALNIFQTINKPDPSDVLNAHQVFQQQQQAAISAAMAAAGGSFEASANANDANLSATADYVTNAAPQSHTNASPQQTVYNAESGQSMTNTQPSASSLENDTSTGNPLYLAHLSQTTPAMYPPNMYGMFSPAPPPPPASSTYQIPQTQQFNSGYPSSMTTQGVRFDITPSMGATPNFSTPFKAHPMANIDMSSVQDREYLDRLAEQYRQNTSSSSRFAQNVPMSSNNSYHAPAPSPKNLTTPIRSSPANQPPSAASSISAYATSSTSGAAPSFLSGCNIRRK